MFEQTKTNTYRLDKDTYLVKGKKSWNIIYPLKKDVNKPFESGNVNWKNMFRMNMTSIVMILIILGVAFSYTHDTRECRELLEHPIGWCGQWLTMNNTVIECTQEQEEMGLCYNIEDLNFSLFEDGEV